MEKKEIIEKLSALIQLDIDAVEAYEQALSNIDIPVIYARISEFRDDHRRHVITLSALVKTYDGEPPAQKDLKGFLIKGFTAIRSATGTKGALKAMQSNEQLTTTTYHEALGWDMPEACKKVIRVHYQDELVHLAYIEEELAMNDFDIPSK